MVGVNIENYSLYPPQSRSSSAPRNFHSSFFSTFIQSLPNYAVPAVRNVHFLFLNVCGLKINYLCEHEFIPRENFVILLANDPKTMTCLFLQSCIQWRRIGPVAPSRDGNFGLETFETRISVLCVMIRVGNCCKYLLPKHL